MKNTLSLICLCALAASCVAETPQSRQADCRKLASDRLALYNKPDTCPISEREKINALNALYDECIRDRRKYYTRRPDTYHVKTVAQSPAQTAKPAQSQPAQAASPSGAAKNVQTPRAWPGNANHEKAKTAAASGNVANAKTAIANPASADLERIITKAD